MCPSVRSAAVRGRGGVALDDVLLTVGEVVPVGLLREVAVAGEDRLLLLEADREEDVALLVAHAGGGGEVVGGGVAAAVSRLYRAAHPDVGRDDPHTGWWQRTAAAPHSRLSADTRRMAQDRTGTGAAFHGRHDRSARIRRQQQAARR